MIAIKDMTMPKSCAECQMSYLSGRKVEYCHCILGVFGVSDIDWNHERHENCPLVNAVSVVHGKWIDETFKPWDWCIIRLSVICAETMQSLIPHTVRTAGQRWMRGKKNERNKSKDYS